MHTTDKLRVLNKYNKYNKYIRRCKREYWKKQRRNKQKKKELGVSSDRRIGNSFRTPRKTRHSF